MTLARTPLGDHDIVVRTGGAVADDLALQAAQDQLNAWGDGRLLIDGHVIQTSQLVFTGNISLGGVTPSAILESRCTEAAFAIYWNSTYNPKTQTTYSFTQPCALADYFTPVGTTLADGDLVCMWSADAITDNASHSGLTYYQYPMEIHQVHEWDSVNGRGYTADPIIDWMQTTPLFCKMTPSTHIMVFDLNMFWGGSTVPGNYHRALAFQNCSGVRIYNLRYPRNGAGQLWFRYCTDVEIDRFSMWGQTNTYGNGPGGEYDGTYGINAAIVNGFRVTASQLMGSRHCFTTEGIDVTSPTNGRQGTSLNCVVEGNTILGPPVKTDEDPTWDERICLDTHSEGYNVAFINNHIHLQSTINSVGIQARSRAPIIRGNHIYGGYRGDLAKPTTTEGIWVTGRDAVIEGNFIDRCSVGIRTKTDTNDYQVYCADVLIGNNTITNCRHSAIVAIGDRTHIYRNKMVNCSYDTTTGRVKALIHLGYPGTKTVSSFSGDTITTTAAHGLVVSFQVRFREGTLPTNLEEGTYYWVVSKTTDTFKISADKGGTPITFTGSPSGTTYVDYTYLPGKDCIVEGNEGHKGNNLTFIACMGLQTDEVTVIDNKATGYGVGTSIFNDAFGEAADMQSAWQAYNTVDGDTSSDVTVVVEHEGVTTSYETLNLAVAAAVSGDKITIPRTGCAISSYPTISQDNIILEGAGNLPKIYRATSATNIHYLVYVTGDNFQCRNITFDGVASGTNTSYGQLLNIQGDDALVADCLFENAYTTGSTANCWGVTLAGARGRLHRVRTQNNQTCYSAVRLMGEGSIMEDCKSYDDIISIYQNCSTSIRSCTIRNQTVYASTGAYGRIRAYNAGSPGYLGTLTIDGLQMSLPNFDLPASSGALDIWNVQDVRLSRCNIYHPTNGTNDEASVALWQDVDRVTIVDSTFSGQLYHLPRNRALSSINAGTDVITCDGTHGMAANRKCIFYNSTPASLPTGISGETFYYVKSPSGADLQISETYGGGAVDLSSIGSGTTYCYGLLEQLEIRNCRFGADATDNYTIWLTSTALRLSITNSTFDNNASRFIYFTSIPTTARWDVVGNLFINDGATNLYVMAKWIKSSGLLLYADNRTELQSSGTISTVTEADQTYLCMNHGSSRRVYAGTGSPPSTSTVTWSKGDRWIDLDADAGDNGTYVVVVGGTSPTWKYETTIEA